MANLIEDRVRTCEFAPLETARLMRLRNRLISVRAIASGWGERSAASARIDGRMMTEAFADQLEEFELAVSEPTLDALLGEIDARRDAGGVRVVANSHSDPMGAIARGSVFGIHAFGRSLATGEAEIASRGFFDERDWPPLELWIETVRQPSLRRDEGVGVGVLFFVPEAFVAGARAGCAACPSGALTLVDERQTRLYAQLTSLMNGDSADF